MYDEHELGTRDCRYTALCVVRCRVRAIVSKPRGLVPTRPRDCSSSRTQQRPLVRFQNCKRNMLLLLILLIAFTEARHRIILQVKDAKNATNIAADLVRDPDYRRSIASHLLDRRDVEPFKREFFGWAKRVWNINVTAGVYNATTGGYELSVGRAYPTTIIDPQHIIIYDSVNPHYANMRSVSVSAWFIEFNTSYVVASGQNAGAYIDTLSALMYLRFFFLKIGADWSKPQNKEMMPCQTDVTAKYFTNQYILGGEWGGLDDVIRYTCFDQTSRPVSYCDKYEINLYDRVPIIGGPLSYVNETARVNYICH